MKFISGSSQYRSKANMTGSKNYTAFFKKRENAPSAPIQIKIESAKWNFIYCLVSVA